MNRLKELKNDLKEMFIYFCKCFVKNHNTIIGWSIIILTLLVMYFIKPENRINYIISYVIVLIILLLFSAILDRKVNKGFPQVSKRFTKQIDDDMIIINKTDWPQAIRYLYDIEEYLKK